MNGLDIVEATKQAFDNGFFVAMKSHITKYENRIPALRFVQPSWKRFFVSCMLLESLKFGGYGDAVIVPREEICPHHFFYFLDVVSSNTHASCAIPVIRRFLKVYVQHPGNKYLRNNTGYIFKLYKRVVVDRSGDVKSSNVIDWVVDGSSESVSHASFLRMLKSSNLRLQDVLLFSSSQNIL
jgi:hypothetical protein